MSRKFNACIVRDVHGKIHDVNVYTNSYEWRVRLRAVRRECERRGIEFSYAYIGGNFWSRHDLATA